MVQLLYGPNEVQPSLKAICYTLKNYVDAIPTEATRSLARRSVASFVTNSADDTQIGTTLFDTAAAAVPEATAAIKAWADRLVDKCLNPRSVSFLDTRHANNGPNGSQPDTFTGLDTRHSYNGPNGSQPDTFIGLDTRHSYNGPNGSQPDSLIHSLD
jgi:hypothetical protein